ncbi:MAG: type I restriction enzyme HsdR N-terminal domain-containing protein, partial [Bacteroidota bacterium]
LNEAAFRQIATYNMELQVPYLLVCNGPQAYCSEIDLAAKSFQFLSTLPPFPAT